MQGKAHPIASCDADSKKRRILACNRCGQVNLMWHRCSTINGHALYTAVKTGYRTWEADTMQPHVCTGKFSGIPAASTPPPPPPAPMVDDRVKELAREAARSTSTELLAKAQATLKGEFDDFAVTVSQGLNEALVKRLDELALPPKVTRIELKGANGELKRIEGTHKQVPELLYWANSMDMNGHRFPVLLFGKPGISKSHSTKQVADSLGLSFGLISLNPQTPESRLFGFYHANGGYIRTAFREAFENGGVYLIDEIDNASDALLTSLNSCLANGHGAFPDGLVQRHKDFICIATANTPGRGGDANHAGRRALDAATINRFVCIEWTNDDELELSMAEAVNPKTGRIWLEWIRKVRAYCVVSHPKVIVSPRSTVMGAKAITDSPFDLATIADMVLFKGLDKDTKAKILSACPLPQVDR